MRAGGVAARLMMVGGLGPFGERAVKKAGCWATGEHGNRVWLTAREMDMLDGVALGLQTRAIARQHFLSEKTVKAHLSMAMRKLGAHTRSRAVVLYLLASPRRAVARFGPQVMPQVVPSTPEMAGATHPAKPVRSLPDDGWA